MAYIAAYHTDVGITKKTNQDSLAIKAVNTDFGQVIFAVVCDGMGGLEKGELASKEVVTAFSAWFDTEIAKLVGASGIDKELLYKQWESIIQTQNKRIGEYGQKHGIMLGTTITAILLHGTRYYTVHVGDSRIYKISNRVGMLTKDQTVVEREIDAGRLAPEQAEFDPRRSVLLQCVGASKSVVPDMAEGTIDKKSVYLVCSDGFRHQITDEELMEFERADSEKAMRDVCVRLTELIKKRKETDNISVIVIREI